MVSAHECLQTTRRRVVCKHSYAVLLLRGARADAIAAEFGLEPAPIVLHRPTLDPDQPVPYTLTPAAIAALDAPVPAA